jgi:hypothetical protein
MASGSSVGAGEAALEEVSIALRVSTRLASEDNLFMILCGIQLRILVRLLLRAQERE